MPAGSLRAPLGDADAKVRAEAAMGLIAHLAPVPPAKPTAAVTPAMRARIEALRQDPAPGVVAAIARLLDRIGPG